VSDQRRDPFEGVVLNHDRIDWSDPTLDADSISLQLIGSDPWEYWDLPEYEGMTHMEIEKSILLEIGRPSWRKTSRHGKPAYQHMLTLIKLMFPDTDITPSLADAVMFFCIGIGGGMKKILNLIGSANSGKSASGCRIAFALMYLDPEYTVVYVANPFDSASDSTVWGDIEELWDQLVEHYPNDTGTGYSDASSLFPWGKKYANRCLEFIPNIPKAARIELRNTKHVGKYKGSKTRGKDVDRGVMLVVVDEVNEIENMAFLTTLANISQQDAFFSITSQNFKNEEDMGGRLAEPKGIYGGPDSYEALDIEQHVWWHSATSSITLRFDGHKSPNILSGRTIYKKLFKKENLQQMLDDYGEASPDYFSQVRSFPARSDETNSVLSRAKISASRCKDTFYSITRINRLVSFCDPAFGGRDKAMWGYGQLVTALVTDGEGSQKVEELIVFPDFFHSLKLVKDAVYNDYWFDRLKAANVSLKDFTLGGAVSYEDQIAIQCHEYNQKVGVRPEDFGYDFSMRPDIVSSMNKVIGFSCHAFDYNQAPEGVFLQNIKKNSEDCCKNRCTELAFLAADFFLTKQVRGGSFIDTAITQLSRTVYVTVNRKYAAEGKKEYKARWQQVSPDNRDVLLGICGMAARKGFRQNNVSTGVKGKSVFETISAGKSFKARVGKRLR
jgi:hypothetical protein